MEQTRLPQKPCPKPSVHKSSKSSKKPKKSKKKSRFVKPTVYDLKLDEIYTVYLQG